MYAYLLQICIIIVLAPLAGSLMAGLLPRLLGRSGAHWVTIIGVGISFFLSVLVFKWIVWDGLAGLNQNLYLWGESGSFHFYAGFLVDHLTAVMMVTVTFVSLLVHIYTIGYMADDPGYQRFFSYMSLFTFAMLALVMANNFLQLFFGWEGVGLVSYLLIGFWYQREAAAAGGLKAFLVNRVGDVGFFLGIAAILGFFGTLDYAQIFKQIPVVANSTFTFYPGHVVPVVTVICILLFIGAMGKSAQMPLHVWLPESMEGPTPISALIHAATMVTAGVFMVARMSPLYEYSETALTIILIVGATGALFTGILALVQQDVKRVIAYSTMSQLGYMMVALGASAYSAGIFQLITHACFKALLFLAAGSVIIALHHEQDMRKMGGLWRYLPVTYVCYLVGALALSAIPPFSGFYSKDSIIEAVKASTTAGATYAYLCVLIGTYVTALYIFRSFFLTFHTKERLRPEVKRHLKESPPVVLVPLVALAIPSVILGAVMIGPILFSEPGLLGNGVLVLPQHAVLPQLAKTYEGSLRMASEIFTDLPVWLSIAGIATAWFVYIFIPAIPDAITKHFKLLYKILLHKYGFDELYHRVFVDGTRELANGLYRYCDMKLIDGLMVNGSAHVVGWISKTTRKLQSGYLFQYALVMVIGVVILMWWILG